MPGRGATPSFGGTAWPGGGVERLLAGEFRLAKYGFRDCIAGIGGFEALGEMTGKSPESLEEMFGPEGDPPARELFKVLVCLQRHEGLERARVGASPSCWEGVSPALVRCAHGPLGPRPRPYGSGSLAYPRGLLVIKVSSEPGEVGLIDYTADPEDGYEAGVAGGHEDGHEAGIAGGREDDPTDDAEDALKDTRAGAEADAAV